MKRTKAMADSSASPKSEAEVRKDKEMLSAIRKKVREEMLLKQKTKTVEAGNVTSRPTSNVTGDEACSTGAIAGFLAFDQAKELQQTPSQQLPSFDKILHVSDISAGKYLDLPTDFCDKHFPKPEGSLLVVDVLLVDEDNVEYAMSYSFQKKRFLGQWRDFYIKHKLKPGNAIRFCQIGNNKFKVYIPNAGESTSNGGSDSSILSNLSHHHDPHDTVSVPPADE